MFTGLVADIGRLRSARAGGGGARVTVTHALGEVAEGDSVAVDGCCLTARAPVEGSFDADISPETFERTGGSRRWRAGRRVNLEPAVAAGQRLGGHWVQGHVDREVRLLARRPLGDGSERARLELPADGRRLVVLKGSVSLDGVSLTVAAMERGWFEVALVPLTLRGTTLGERRPGEMLNIEYDILGKYVAAHLGAGDARGLGPLGG